MYAIIQAGGRQYQVRPADVIEVNRLAIDEGGDFETDQVLLARPEGEEAVIGAPYVSGAKVRGRVLGHKRGNKVLVFKFKRRKNYKRTKGHRQELTRLRIESIEVAGKKVEAPAAAPKAKAKVAAKTATEKDAKATVKTGEDKPKAAPKAKAASKAGEDKPKAASKAKGESGKTSAKSKKDD